MNITRTVTIPAAINNVDGVYAESTVGMRYFICLSASASFQVQFDQQQQFDSNVGVSRDAGAEGMRHLLLTNKTATAITATFVLSDAPHLSPPSVLTGTSLFFDEQSQSDLPGNTSWLYPGTRVINGQSCQRKYLEVEFGGTTANKDLHVCQTLPLKVIARLQEKTVRRFDLSEDLTIRNVSSANLQVTVYEVF